MATRVGRGSAAVAICVVGVLIAAVPAGAAVTCDYNQGAEVLAVTANADNDFVLVQVEGGGEIVVTHTATGQANCDTGGGDPTVTNTGNINLFDTNVDTTWLLADPEDLVPGTGTSGEVETAVALADGDDTFALADVDGTSDFWTLGALGMNWSGDLNREISFVTAVDVVGFVGNDGDDPLTARGGQGTGNAFSGPGVFTAVGDGGNDVIEGGDSGDDLTGGSGDDELTGFAGGDSLTGDAGTNQLQGGTGDDRARYFSDAGVTVDLGVTGPQNTGVGTDTLSEIEGVEGTNEADTLVGNGDANALLGHDGDDLLDGRGGSDSLEGGADIDTATYESAPAGVDVNLDADTTTGGAGNDILDNNIENLIGSPFADSLTGDSSNNSITPLGGRDTVRAEGGADAVRVRDGGPDTADCGDGPDTATADAATIDALTACEDVLSPPTGGGDAGGEPDNVFTFGKAKKNKRKGTAKLTVNVPGAGDLGLAKTKTVKPDEERADAAGSEKLLVKAKGKGKKSLRNRGKAKVLAEVTYTPDGGDPNTQEKRVKLARRG